MIRVALILLCLSTLVFTGCVSKSDYDKLKSELDTALAAKLSAQAELDTAEEEVQSQEARVKALEVELNALNSRFISVQGALEDIQARYDGAVDEAAAYKNQVSVLDRELELYKETWGSRVAEGQPNFQVSYLHNKPTAEDPTYDELKAFIKADTTDTRDYVKDTYMCGEFAADVHDNAETAGINAGWVAILLEDDGQTSYHALNVFNTTDKGLIFIDCTGLMANERGPSSCDKIVNVKLDSLYKPRSLFGTSGWKWLSMGLIKDVEVYW